MNNAISFKEIESFISKDPMVGAAENTEIWPWKRHAAINALTLLRGGKIDSVQP